MRGLAAALLLAFFLAAPALAQRAPSDYRQTDAVLAHYPALKEVPLQSPAFAAATPSLTSQNDLPAFVTGLAGNSGADRRIRTRLPDDYNSTLYRMS